MLHFTIKKEDDSFLYPYPDAKLGVNVIHIWHNFEASEMTTTYKDMSGNIVKEDISLADIDK